MRQLIEWLHFHVALRMPMWLSRYHWWWTFVGSARKE
jgi:hypothetical protein